mmetsp:Transcript_66809/g.105694  ORF Transcript_66809/g.105694 Transcript_66809/m.105694 type:complete len:291 (+) Transcript_66809:474-1346(+)
MHSLRGHCVCSAVATPARLCHHRRLLLHLRGAIGCSSHGVRIAASPGLRHYGCRSCCGAVGHSLRSSLISIYATTATVAKRCKTFTTFATSATFSFATPTVAFTPIVSLSTPTFTFATPAISFAFTTPAFPFATPALAFTTPVLSFAVHATPAISLTTSPCIFAAFATPTISLATPTISFAAPAFHHPIPHLTHPVILATFAPTVAFTTVSVRSAFALAAIPISCSAITTSIASPTIFPFPVAFSTSAPSDIAGSVLARLRWVWLWVVANEITCLWYASINDSLDVQENV